MQPEKLGKWQSKTFLKVCKLFLNEVWGCSAVKLFTYFLEVNYLFVQRHSRTIPNFEAFIIIKSNERLHFQLHLMLWETASRLKLASFLNEMFSLSRGTNFPVFPTFIADWCSSILWFKQSRNYISNSRLIELSVTSNPGIEKFKELLISLPRLVSKAMRNDKISDIQVNESTIYWKRSETAQNSARFRREAKGCWRNH